MGNDLSRILRERIINLQYKPGSPLSESKLAEEFGVSRTPIREALILLSEEHLVTLVPHSMARVSDANLHDFHQLIQCRLVLERGVAKLAVLNATDADIHALEILKEKSQRIKDYNTLEFLQCDTEFHRIIRKAAANCYLDKYLLISQNLFTRIQYIIAHRPERMLTELSKVIDALKNRDQTAMETLLVSHVEHFVKVVRNNFRGL